MAKKPEPHVKTAFGVGGAAGGLGGAAVQYAMVGALSPPMLGVSMLTGAFSALGVEVAKPSKSTKEAICKSAAVGGFVGGTTSAACIKGRVLMSGKQKEGLLKALKEGSRYGEDSKLFEMALKKTPNLKHEDFLRQVVAKNPNAIKDIVFTSFAGGANGLLVYNTLNNMFTEDDQQGVIIEGAFDEGTDESDQEEGQKVTVAYDYNYFEGELTRFILNNYTDGVSKLSALDSESMRRVVGLYWAMFTHDDSEDEIKERISQMIELEMNRKSQRRR